jgi:glycosyltransferase involved in cell wall biosynthesis
MKILMLSPQPFFQIRGTPLNIRNILSALSEAGHEVDLLTYPFGVDLSIPGVTIRRIRRLPWIKEVKIGPSWPKFFMDLVMVWSALLLCMRNRYTVIHAVEESVFFAVFLKAIFRTKLIYDMDSMISDQLRYSKFIKSGTILKFVAKLEEWVVRRCDCVITVCESLTDSIKTTGTTARVEQIEDAPLDNEFNPDTEGASALRRDLAIGDRPVILYTGNFEEYQGIDLLIDSAKHTIDTRPDCRFVLVGGEPSDVSRMKAYAEKQGVSDNFVFTGRRPLAEMRKFLTAANILVAPRTRGTNTALKIYGYMQSAKPIVATKLKTHTQVLDDQCAVLVDPTPQSFSDGVLYALTHTESASLLGNRAQQIVERYSLREFYRKVRLCYDRLTPA